MTELHNQNQWYKGNIYAVADIVSAARNLDVVVVDIRSIYKNYNFTEGDNKSIIDFVEEIKRIQDADLKYPIILSMDGAVLDGKHRVAKTLLLNKKTIKCKFLEALPPAISSDE